MLKLGTVRWRGKCPRHPRFDPNVDGPGAVKGGCPKCAALAEIHELHRKMLSLMRNFTPPQAPRRRRQPPPESQQASFFDEL